MKLGWASPNFCNWPTQQVEPATYDLGGLANLLQTISGTDIQWIWFEVFVKTLFLWPQVGSDTRFIVSAGVCRENRQIQASFYGALDCIDC